MIATRLLAACVVIGIACPAVAEPDLDIDSEPDVLVTGSQVAPRFPVELVRTLKLLQDRIVAGSTAAHVGQGVLLSHIHDRLAAAGEEAWRDPRNVRAAVIYVLSGGRPDILRNLQKLDFLADQERFLVNGAIAYHEGREADARDILSKVDIDALPASLAGQVALVQSALVVREAPREAMVLLRKVRLLLPGTLLEEAALRREIFVASQLGDVSAFESLSKQYLRRFRASVYVGNFRQRFAVSLTQLEYASEPKSITRLDELLRPFDPPARKDLYLLVARAAIDQGKTVAAMLAAERARGLAGADPAGARRARLYRAAALIVTPKGFGEGLAELKALDRAALSEEDTNLLDAALSLAGQIRDGLAPVPTKPAPSIAAPMPVTPTIARAGQALGRIDELFRKVQ